MPQAKSHNTKDVAKGLIANWKRVAERLRKAEEALMAVKEPHSLIAPVPEIEPEATAYSTESLERMVKNYLSITPLRSLELIEFNQRISTYRTAITLVEKAIEAWRVAQKVPELEKESGEAYEAHRAQWKAIIGYVKSHPKEIGPIAKFFSAGAEDTLKGEPWRWLDLLRAVASAKEAA